VCVLRLTMHVEVLHSVQLHKTFQGIFSCIAIPNCECIILIWPIWRCLSERFI
jgi:hypothetical protein